MRKYPHPLVNEFLIEKAVNEGCSPATIRTYTTVFNTLSESDFISLSDLSTFDERNFRRFLAENHLSRNWTSHAYNRYRKNLKVYCEWLVRSGFLQENPFSRIPPRRMDKTLPKFLSQKQVDLILYAANSLYSGDDFLSVRNRSVIYFYLYTGVRLKELVDLSVSDVDFLESTILIRHGKGWKDRMLPLVRRLESVLRLYLPVRDSAFPKSPHFFPTKHGNAMQQREINVLVKKLRSRLDFHFTCHMLRHSFATELARKNVSIFTISSLLGHSNLDTAKIYTKFCSSSAKETLDSLDLYR